MPKAPKARPKKIRRGYRPKSRDEIARNMSAIRSIANKTEVALGRGLHALGLRYRKYGSVYGRPDIVFPTERIAVFVDGDYWHGRILVEGGRRALQAKLRRLSPKSRSYWMTKFARRVERDGEVTWTLRAEGWIVIRMWESDVKRDLETATRRVARKVFQRRARLTPGVSTPAVQAKSKG